MSMYPKSQIKRSDAFRRTFFQTLSDKEVKKYLQNDCEFGSKRCYSNKNHHQPHSLSHKIDYFTGRNPFISLLLFIIIVSFLAYICIHILMWIIFSDWILLIWNNCLSQVQTIIRSLIKMYIHSENWIYFSFYQQHFFTRITKTQLMLRKWIVLGVFFKK